jgi:hypothetical protein
VLNPKKGIYGSHNGEHENFGVLGCNTVYSTFGTVVPEEHVNVFRMKGGVRH